MNEVDIASTIAQFGAAGLVGWMWLTERRTAAVRDQQVAQSHERLMQARTELDVLVRALESNTRAMTALEVGQRHVLEVLAHLAGSGRGPRQPSSVTLDAASSRSGPTSTDVG